MIGLQRLFKMMDDDGSMTLSMPEFGKACKDFKIGISEENVPILFNLFDKNGDGTLQYDEFINTVRTPMTPARA
jgi:Ca2+-binding EF-hand superfamily protein